MAGPITTAYKSRKIMVAVMIIGTVGLVTATVLSFARPITRLAGGDPTGADLRPIFIKLDEIMTLGILVAATGGLIIAFGLLYRSFGRTF